MKLIKNICLLFFVFCFLPCAFSLDSELRNLPLPSFTQLIFQDKGMELNGRQAKMTHLVSKLTLKEIGNFYRTELAQRGWEFANYLAHLSTFAFTKDNEFVYVMVRGLSIEAQEDETKDIYIVHSFQNLAICFELIEKLFTEKIAPDIEGKDMPGVPRYYNSRRRLNLFTPGGGDLVMYESEAQPGEIMDFYRDQMPDAGWELDEDLNHPFFEKNPQEFKEKMRTFPLTFQKDDESITIMAFPGPKQIYPHAKTVIYVINNNFSGLFSEIKEFQRLTEE